VNAIFVYGLLKPGLRLHHVVEPFVVRSAPGTATARLYDAGLPAARFDEDGALEGFVFWLDESRLEEALRVLDDLEDEGEMYSRIAIDVDTKDGTVRAQAYHYLLSVEGRDDAGRSWGKD
jgi:gamma-glutamylcyclotransferase (GGCT)/AIG2-like uncharacterized protein YtfP